MKFNSKNSFQSLDILSSSGKDFKYFNLKTAEKNGLDGISKLPKSLKVLLENLLRYEDDVTVDKKQILALKDWLKNKKSNTEIAYRPARTLLQDYTGIPAIADLAAMRDAVKDKNKNPDKINPLSTVTLSSYLRRFSNNTLSDLGSFDVPSSPFFSAVFKLKYL